MALKKPENKGYVKLTIFLTYECLFSCSHCFVRKGGYFPNSRLSIEELDTLFKVLRKYFTEFDVGWGGGEVYCLGKEFMKRLVESEFFNKEGVVNTLATTLCYPIDSDWIDILNRFKFIITSIDRSHQKNRNFDIRRIKENIEKLSIPVYISYTPHLEDDEAYIDFIFSEFSGVKNVKSILFGMLYTKDFLPISHVIKLFTYFEKKLEEYGMSSLWTDVSEYTPFPSWIGYNCFANALFVSKEVVTPCYPLYAFKNLIPYKFQNEIPVISFKDFLDNPEKLFSMTENFVKEYYLSVENFPEECRRCRYYGLCRRGCPFFAIETNKREYYCPLYQRAFEIYFKKLKGGMGNGKN